MNKKNKIETPSTKKTEVNDILSKLTNYLDNSGYKIIYILLGLNFLLGLLMFDVKISTGHDDALYLESAFNWSKDFTGYFYTANAPLYIMFLIIPIKMFGLNLILLKFLSLIFFTLSIYFFFLAFFKRINNLILFTSILLTCVNWFLLSYASLTYTECFFMFLSSLFFYGFFNLKEKLDIENWTLKTTYSGWIFLGLGLLILSLTRNIAIVCILAVLVYFVLNKQFKALFFTIISFSFFKIIYEIVKSTIWGNKAILSDQFEIILRKEAYNPSAGYEDLSGFFTRFISNSVIYLSGRFWEIIGFKEDNGDFNPILTILLFIIFGYALVSIIRKKEKYLLAAVLFCYSILFATFFALQTSWGQGRFVMIHLPILFIVIFYFVLNVFKRNGIIYILILGLFFAVSISKTFSKTEKNLKYLPKNLSGDIFAGYSDDWVNYLKLSKWCGENLPPNSVVACRKAPMSFVYASNIKFFPIYSVQTQNPDTILNILKKNKVTHVIFANLRLDPKINGDVASLQIDKSMPPIFLAYQDIDQKRIINTIHNYFVQIAQTKPESFELIKVMGVDEESILYKIKY
jgi:hypothetical protein